MGCMESKPENIHGLTEVLVNDGYRGSELQIMGSVKSLLEVPGDTTGKFLQVDYPSCLDEAGSVADLNISVSLVCCLSLYA